MGTDAPAPLPFALVFHAARQFVVFLGLVNAVFTADPAAALGLWGPLGVYAAATALLRNRWHRRILPIWAADLLAVLVVRSFADVGAAGEPMLALVLAPVSAGLLGGTAGVVTTAVVTALSLGLQPVAGARPTESIAHVLVLTAMAAGGSMLTALDGNHRRRAMQETTRSLRVQAVLSAVVRSDPRGIVVRDADEVVVEINETVCRLLGVNASNFLEFAGGIRTIPGRLYDEDGEPWLGALPSELALQTGSVVTEQIVRIGEDAPVWLAVSAVPVDTPDGRWVVTQLRDVTEETSTLSRLQRQAAIDPLTGVGNRRLLEWAAESPTDPDEPMVVVLLDVDDFKDINDTHGHDIGDEILRDLANRLLGACRPDDLVVRLGGDEFVAVLRNIDEAGAGAVVARLRQALDAPYRTGAGSLTVGASVGQVAGRAGELRSLVRGADGRMYAAKQRHRVHAMHRHPSTR